VAQVTFTVVVHEEDDGSFWAEVEELPGCFASGFSLEELREAAFEAMQLWLPDGIKLDDPEWAPLQEKPTGKGKSSGGKKKDRPTRQMLVCV
jgi:predicted RNase H-like HicB family nuclease